MISSRGDGHAYLWLLDKDNQRINITPMPTYKVVFHDRDKPLICDGSVVHRNAQYREFIQFVDEDTREILAMIPIEKVLYIKKVKGD